MALPIKDTPILVGAEARRFWEKMEENKKRKVPEEEYKRALESYRLVTTLATQGERE